MLSSEASKWLSGKESACQSRRHDSIPGSGRSPGEGNGNPLYYSCLGNPIDRGGWWATVHGAAKSQEQLNNWVCLSIYFISAKEKVSKIM